MNIRSNKQVVTQNDRLEKSYKMQAEKILVRPPKGIPPKLLAEYLYRCVSALPGVKEALERSDLKHTQVFGHRLRGTGAAYGLPILTEIGALIEEASIRRETAELRRHVAELEANLSQIEIASA